MRPSVPPLALSSPRKPEPDGDEASTPARSDGQFSARPWWKFDMTQTSQRCDERRTDIARSANRLRTSQRFCRGGIGGEKRLDRQLGQREVDRCAEDHGRAEERERCRARCADEAVPPRLAIGSPQHRGRSIRRASAVVIRLQFAPQVAEGRVGRQRDLSRQTGQNVLAPLRQVGDAGRQTHPDAD